MRNGAERVIRTIGQVKEIWAEFDYAQRRLLEVQLGVPVRRVAPPTIAASVDELRRSMSLKSRDSPISDPPR